MSHFAELNSNNVVLRVVVVSDDDIADENGQQQEALGVTFLRGLFGADTRWVMTSYSGSYRGRYAGIGDVYDEPNDVFVTLSAE